ncbi:MAG: hypothetical protein FJ095_01530 [Deltaproteobacteria bacterium]|nr:hypothetical protein [Deltaproteobacteria bacterium]
MRAPPLDERGLAREHVALVTSACCHSVLSPELDGRFAFERWSHGAQRYFDHDLLARPPKSYDAGWPVADAGVVDVVRADGARRGRVLVTTAPLERAGEVLVAARAAVVAMGGAGFDALVARTRRVWQLTALEPADGGPHGGTEESGSVELLVAAVLASTLLGPILAPDGALFGVKTARERLARMATRAPR